MRLVLAFLVGVPVRRVRLWLFIGTCIGGLTATGQALAAEPDSLEYEGASDCPTRQQVMERIRRFHATDDRVLPPLKLSIESGSPRHFRAQLRLGNEPARELNGRTCGELVDAVLVIVRIWATRDKNTSELAREAPSSADTSDPLSRLGVEDETSAPQMNEGTVVTPIANSAPSESTHANPFDVTAAPVPPRRAPVLPRLHFESGVSSAIGVAPGLSLGVLGRVGVARNSNERFLLRLGLLDSKSSSQGALASVVWSRLAAFQVGACARLDRRSSVLVDVCVDISLGRFRAGAVAGPVITQTSSVTRPWLAAGPAMRSEFPLLRDRLGIWFEVSLPIVVLRERLVYAKPDTDIHHTWIVTPTIQVGLRCSFGGSGLLAAGTAH